MPLPPDYNSYAAMRKRAMGLPFANSNAYSPQGPTPVIGAGGGRGTTVGTAPPSAAAPVWEGSSNAGGQQFTNVNQGGGGGRGYGGGYGGAMGGRGYGGGMMPPPRIGGGGEAPLAATAADYERSHGGLSRDYGSMGSLGDFYAANARDPNTGNRITNPYTGLPYNSSANDRQQQQQLLQQKGDVQGLAALGGYNAARASGNPYAIQAAQQGIAGIQGQRAYQAGFSGGEDDWVTKERQKQQQQQQQPADAMTDENAMYAGARAKGGPVGRVNPYMVGEKGPEEFVGKDGKKQMVGMNGPQVGTFNEPGRIIPNNKLAAPMRAMAHKPMGMGMKGVTHAADGADPVVPIRSANVAGSNPYIGYGVTQGPLERIGLLPHDAPLAGLERSGVGLIERGLNAAQYPFVSPPAPRSIDSRAHGDVSVPYTPPAPFVGPPSPYTGAPTGDEYTSAGMPSGPHDEPEWETPPTRIANPLTPSPFTVQPSPLPMGPPKMAAPLQQGMYARGATEIAPNTFATRYGTVSSAPVAPAERTIEGLPVSEWFARAANRWGTNPYASPSKGFPTEGTEVQAANRGMKRDRIEANNKKFKV